MSDHFTYFYPILPDQNWQKLIAGVLLGAGLVYLGKKLTARLSTTGGIREAVVPEKQFTLFGFFDFFTESFVKFQDSVMGPENRKYLPFTGSIFLFILLSNFLGLIPGMPAITTTVWINVGLAMVVFCYFNYLGVKTHGLFGYLKHFWGPIFLLGFFLFPLEIFSTCLRILTLNLRLYWNISADHMVLEAFTDLVPIIPAILYVLGSFVCFMQAFIFTTLTMVYILLATQVEEGHH